MKPLVRRALSAALALWMCGVGGFAGVAPAHADDAVSIPDSALHACIAAELASENLPPTFSVTNLALVKELACFDRNLGQIKDLTGLHHLVALESLVAFETTISDLRPIAGLAKLSTVEIMSSEPYQLGPLTTLPSITKVSVDVSPTTDIAPISQLTTVRKLYLDVGGMARSPAVDLPASVEEFALDGDVQLTSLGAVSGGKGVTNVVVFGPNLTSLDGLEGLTSVSYLYAARASLTDLSALAGMSSLGELTLNANPSLDDLHGIEGLASLRTLNLSSTKVTDLGLLAGLTALETLHLDQNAIFDLSPLRSLVGLKKLTLWKNRIKDLTPLIGLPALTSLQVSDNLLINLGPEGAFHRLTYLSAFKNSITSIAGLSGARLTTVDLRWNQITDIGALRDVDPAGFIDLGWNQIRDFSPLPDHVTFTRLNQTLGSLPDATVGTPYDLGIRDADGTRVCPTLSPAAPCADGAVTYVVPGTYDGRVSIGAGDVSVRFTQHAGPDRMFTRTFAPAITSELVLGEPTAPEIPAWTPRVYEYTYEWFRDGKPVSGLNPRDANLAATAADLGHRFFVCVTGHIDGYVPTRLCSNTGKLVSGTPRHPAYAPIDGLAVTDSTLTVDSQFWESGVTLTYQWQRNHKNIRGATAATYHVRSIDVRHSIRAVVTGSKPGYHPISIYSPSVRPKKAGFTGPTPVITGVTTTGQRLAATAGTWVPASAHLTYRWYRNGRAISHATKDTYLLKARDRGKVIKVRVTATRAGYVTKRVYSLPTAKIT